MLDLFHDEIAAVYRLERTVSTPTPRCICGHGRAMTSQPIPNSRTIVLVGLMGAGKTAIGRRLAARLGLPFVDADAEIELAAGCSIPEFFARYGEDAFRDGERRVIARLLRDPPHVLATGGGTFMDEETRNRIAESAVSVWLRADLDVLVSRCARRNNRPLLKRGDPRKILGDLIEERYPVYAEADVVVDSIDGPHETVVDEIVKLLIACEQETPTESAVGTSG